MQQIRLQKFMADSGIASRRKCEEIISSGKVKVNGRIAKLGDKIDPVHDTVMYAGKRIRHKKANSYKYIMLHKPRGFVTTMDDELGRKCVSQLVSNVNDRVYPVGRLDKDSEGLLIMTSDGEFTNAMTHPSKGIPKVYRVTVRPDVTEEQLTAFAVGIEIDGRKTAPANAVVLVKQENRVVLEITLFEGRNREIRKMCESLGLEVARLKRIAFGTLKLGMLKQGDWRFLTEDEVRSLKIAAGLKVNKIK